jgi:hypothetical protein
MKIHPMGADFFHAGGRMDITKLILTFRNFANALNNWVISGKSFVWSTPEQCGKKLLPGSLAFKDLIWFVGGALKGMFWPSG